MARTKRLALKYSNMGARFSASSSNIQTLTLALVSAVYRCLSSEHNTLCWSGLKVKGRLDEALSSSAEYQHFKDILSIVQNLRSHIPVAIPTK